MGKILAKCLKGEELGAISWGYDRLNLALARLLQYILDMITETRIQNSPGYFLVFYRMNGIWRQYDRPFKDKRDAQRFAKSIIQSQGFNGLTNGGLA